MIANSFKRVLPGFCLKAVFLKGLVTNEISGLKIIQVVQG